MSILHLKKRYKILSGIIIFLVLVLFSIPRVARWYIEKHSVELIGRTVHIDKIRLNYFTGTLRINNLQLFESDSKTVFLSFKQLKINIDYLPLLKNEFFVKYISLDEPYVQVLQNGDEFNFSGMSKSDSTAVKTDTIPKEPAKFIINNIQIVRGYVKYSDVPLNHTIALKNLDLVIPGFTWNSDSTNLDVDFRFVDGGRFYSSLSLNQADSTYSFNLKLDSLNLDIVEPYVKNYMHISALHGYLTNELLIKGSMQSIMKLFVKGINHVQDFQLIDTTARTIFSFKDLTVVIDTILPEKNRIDLNYVGLTDPFILFEMIDSTNNWLSLMKPSAEEPSDSLSQQNDTIPAETHGSYSFTKLQISGGTVQFSDKTLRYPFDYTINNLSVESSEIAGISDKYSLDIKAGLNGTGNLATTAILDPENLNDLDLTLSIDQFRMKDMDAYFKHYFGFPVTGGIMNFKTQDKMGAESLVSDNSLYFRKFTLAKSMHNKSEYKVPLRLALGVLSDKDGIIDLKAPFETKGDEVKFKNLGKMIFRIIGNLFVKAAVSPFNMLSDLYKVDPATLQEIRLGLNEASPNEENMKSVDIITDILNKKPALNIDFYYCIDRNKVADTLSYLISMDDYIRYAKSIGMNIRSIGDSTLIKYLLDKPSSASLKENPQLNILCRAFIGTEKLDARIDSVKALQINFMKNYLSGDKGISADRFKIIETAPDTIKPSSDFPSFRTYFNTAEEKQE
ncbi:MAG: DUF748 domain-containing protein [Bacteroidales bacterium]|nr:DUF748 domain-containing protein [Bacteroidales bacterium]